MKALWGTGPTAVGDSTATVHRGLFAATALALLFAATGCNAVTGVGDLRVQSDELGDGSGDGAGDGETPDPKPQCTYPEGAYAGAKLGSVIPATREWDGYAEGASEPSKIRIEDYYDCDGSKGINAILIEQSAMWCGACQQEASQLNHEMSAKWAEMGIRVITLMIEKIDSSPADVETALQWKTKFKLESVAVLADPKFSFFPAGKNSVGLPVQLVVNPRTMEIVDLQEGSSGTHPALEKLAQDNAMAQ